VPTGASDPADPGRDNSPLSSFLTAFVRTNPGLKFGPIVRATQEAFHVSRATAARQLARLVRFGDLAQLPGRTYVAGGSSGAVARAVVEVRWQDQFIVVQPNGTGRFFHQREFRVVSGQLEFIDFTFPRRPRGFSWWLSGGAKLDRTLSGVASSPLNSYRLDLEAPLTSRSPVWRRLAVSAEMEDWFQMVLLPTETPASRRGRIPLRTEFICHVIPAQARVYEQKVSPECHIRTQIVLPSQYPVGRPRAAVTWQTNPDRSDSAEATRVESAAREEWHQDGFHRSGTTFTLSVARPKLDRRYCILWDLPSAAQRSRWLASHPTTA